MYRALTFTAFWIITDTEMNDTLGDGLRSSVLSNPFKKETVTGVEFSVRVAVYANTYLRQFLYVFSLLRNGSRLLIECKTSFSSTNNILRDAFLGKERKKSSAMLTKEILCYAFQAKLYLEPEKALKIENS